MVWCVSKWFLFPSFCQKHIFSPDNSLWEPDRILGGKMHKMCPLPPPLVAGFYYLVFVTQTCPCGTSINSSTKVRVLLPWKAPVDVSVCGFLLWKVQFIVSECWPLQFWRQQFSFRSYFPNGCKKSCWFFRLFGFSLVRIEGGLLGSDWLDWELEVWLIIKKKKTSMLYFCFSVSYHYNIVISYFKA